MYRPQTETRSGASRKLWIGWLGNAPLTSCPRTSPSRSPSPEALLVCSKPLDHLPYSDCEFGIDTPQESPVPTRSSTPRHFESKNGRKGKAAGGKGRLAKTSSAAKKLVVTCDSDIEPDELVPKYLDTKARLLEFERGYHRSDKSQTVDTDEELAVAKLEAKIRKIEADVLFDKYEAEQLWKAQKINLEKQLAAAKKEAEVQAETQTEVASTPDEPTPEKTDEDEINDEANRIAAEILAEANEDDDDIGGLFTSLPQNEVDDSTGESRTVVNSTDGSKIVIRDFGKWTGVSPRRALEEACRSR